MESKNTLVRAVCQCSTLVRTCLPVACRMYTVCCLSPVHVYPDLCVCACVCMCVCMDDVSDHPLGVCAVCLRQACARKKYARVCMRTKIHIIDTVLYTV